MRSRRTVASLRLGLGMALGLGSLALAGCPDRTPAGTTQGALACAFADEGRADAPVMALVADGELRLVRGGLTSETVLAFAEGHAFTWMATQVEQRDGLILATAQYDDADSFSGTLFEAALVSADGRIVWHQAGDDRWNQAFLGQGGAVAFGRFGGDGAVRLPDGSERLLPGLLPLAPPLADGTVAARTSSWSALVWGWARPGAGELDPLAFIPQGEPLSWNGKLVYVASEGMKQVLVLEGPAAAEALELPVLPDDGGAWLSVVREEGWALVACAGYAAPAFIRVNLTTGAAERLTVEPPDGFREFNSTQWGTPFLDADGALLIGLRDDFQGGLFRTWDGATWDRVGGSVSDVLAVEADSRAGTYLILGTNARYSWEEWLEPPEGQEADLVGDSLHVARPGSGGLEMLPASFDFWIARSPSTPTPLISPDGACVAYWEFPVKAFPQLWTLDVTSGERFRIGAAGAAAGTPDPFSLAWLPATSATR